MMLCGEYCCGGVVVLPDDDDDDAVDDDGCAVIAVFSVWGCDDRDW